MIDRPRILIIDEDRRTVDKLQEHFTQRGYEAEVALSGDVGVAIVEERRMNVTILNGQLGHARNWALVRQLRQFDPRMPLILFNGPKIKGITREAKRAGVTRFIAQPVETEDLMIEALKILNG